MPHRRLPSIIGSGSKEKARVLLVSHWRTSLVDVHLPARVSTAMPLQTGFLLKPTTKVPQFFKTSSRIHWATGQSGYPQWTNFTLLLWKRTTSGTGRSVTLFGVAEEEWKSMPSPWNGVIFLSWGPKCVGATPGESFSLVVLPHTLKIIRKQYGQEKVEILPGFQILFLVLLRGHDSHFTDWWATTFPHLWFSIQGGVTLLIWEY